MEGGDFYHEISSKDVSFHEVDYVDHVATNYCFFFHRRPRDRKRLWSCLLGFKGNLLGFKGNRSHGRPTLQQFECATEHPQLAHARRGQVREDFIHVFCRRFCFRRGSLDVLRIFMRVIHCPLVCLACEGAEDHLASCRCLPTLSDFSSDCFRRNPRCSCVIFCNISACEHE